MLFGSCCGAGVKQRMVRKKCEGTPLEVFSGKQAKLNRIILPLLKKEALAKEDVYHILRKTKGYRHITSKTVCRRMDDLIKRRLIAPRGTRPSAVQGECILYKLTSRGEAALSMDRRSGDNFLETGTDEDFNAFKRFW